MNQDFTFYCYELKKGFARKRDALAFLGRGTSSDLHRALDNPKRVFEGYHWCSSLDKFNNVKLTKGRTKRAVYCHETKQKFNSILDAAKFLKCNRANFNNVINNPNRAVYGLHYCTDLSVFNNVKLTVGIESCYKAIYCYETKQKFNSIKDAAIWANIDSASLLQALNKPDRLSANYHWCSSLEIFDGIKLKYNYGKLFCYETKEEFSCPKDVLTKYPSLAHRTTGNLTRVLDNPYLLFNGYHWHTKPDYVPISTSSAPENEIKLFIEALGHTPKKNRTILNGKEIDLYIKEKNLGIEFNGLYWHREDHIGRNYHQEKTFLGNSRSTKIIQIFEHQWKDRNFQIKNMLKAKLGHNKILFARKCEIVELDNVSEFLEANHIQGRCKSLIKLGLSYNNELVAVMTFGRPRFNKVAEWELLRFCNKAEYSITGGASKILKHFEKKFNPQNILSYANLQWSDGNLYEQIGFNKERVSAPNYWWVKDQKILTRYQCQKQKLKNFLADFKEEETEKENMMRHGYYRVFDCGNLIYKKTYL